MHCLLISLEKYTQKFCVKAYRKTPTENTKEVFVVWGECKERTALQCSAFEHSHT